MLSLACLLAGANVQCTDCHAQPWSGGVTWLQEIKQDLAEAGWDGVKLGGNYVAGVALGKCVEFGYELADQVTDYLQGLPEATGAAAAKTPESQETVFV